jgi:hypothetical protein
MTLEKGLRLASVTVAALVLAASGMARADIMDACRGDYMRLCATVLPGEGRIARCLAENRPSLSPACEKSLTAAMACKTDIEAFCRASSGLRELRACLAGVGGKLTAQCQASLKKGW